MPDRTGISWTDATWNPVTGCSKVSTGCKNCFAAALAPRLAAMGQKGYTDKPWTKANAEENVHLHPDRLEKPLHWKKPRRVFVNSMSDLFHELVPDEFINRVFAVMALASQHTFQVLTKRPERMAEYLRDPWRWTQVEGQAHNIYEAHTGEDPAMWLSVKLPLPNVWCGTSVENQRAADERIPHLLRTPAAVRFLSCEPLLGPVNITDQPWWDWRYTWDFYKVAYPDAGPPIDWIIAGGESGNQHREMQLDWARSLRDQSQAANVAFFFKQHSGPRPASKKTKVLLDGEEWHQFPAPNLTEVLEKARLEQ